jgi:iron complex transport system substrate-binding protein
MARAPLFFALALLVCGCPNQQKPAARLRVVSLVPSVTEVIYAVGAEKSLVGSTNQCDYPDAARAVYKVGDFMNPDVERIVALGPGLVFATPPIQKQLVDKLTELKIPVYVSRPQNVEAVFREIDSVGVLLGVRARAEQLVAAMMARLDSLPRYTDTPRVYVEISAAPLMTAGGHTFINGLIERAGGRNVFGDALQEYPVIDAEMVVQRDPQAILLLHPDAKALDVVSRVGWSCINAVKGGRVYDDLDYDLFFRPGPRIADGIVLLFRLLHPPSR